uniref:Uncharacterized protein n=1 Tax=Glossina palpalis gambiensis TaxID=67801 RepID=A0A1B0BXJ3_9MUSC
FCPKGPYDLLSIGANQNTLHCLSDKDYPFAGNGLLSQSWLINVFISVPSYLILTIFLAEISPQYIRPSKQSLSKPMAIEATDIGFTFFALTGARTMTTPWEIIRKPESCCWRSKHKLPLP